MEIEIKYQIQDRETADAIWESDYFKHMEEAGSRESLIMKCAYFDTEDSVLRQKDIAFRVRTEGLGTVATLKWNGNSQDGLHVREEINVPITDPACLIQPSPDIFKESEDGKALLEIVGDKPLISVLEIHFRRRRLRVDRGDCLCEVVIDVGEIVTDYGEVPICELEVELFTGSKEALLQIGAGLAKHFKLTPINESKYARGLQVLDAARK